MVGQSNRSAYNLARGKCRIDLSLVTVACVCLKISCELYDKSLHSHDSRLSWTTQRNPVLSPDSPMLRGARMSAFVRRVAP